MQTASPPFALPVPPPPIQPVRPESLTDAFGRRHSSLRVSVTDRCNLKCTYCRPAALQYGATARGLTDDELVSMIGALAERGATKIRLTGGEPLLRPGLAGLAGRVRVLPHVEFVGITSNGVVLEKHLDELLEAGVDGINLSLDTFDRERFRQFCGVDASAAVLRSLDGVLARPFAHRKLNAVIQRGVNDDELVRFATLARDHALDVRFLEFLPFAGNGWTPERWLPATEMIAQLEQAFGVAFHALPYDDGVARMYEIDGFRGRLGFITGISHKFCDSCTRLRLTARGELRPCLYLDRGIDLRPAVNGSVDTSALETRIAAALEMKPFENGLNPHHAPAGVPVMTTIGG